MRARRSCRFSLLAGACATALISIAAPASAQEGPAPLLTVGVDVTDASMRRATYSLLVVNHGDATANGVSLTNPVPGKTTFEEADRQPLDPASCKPGAPAGTQCRWAVGDLAPGTSATVAVTYALEQSEAAYPTAVHSFVNVASAQVANAPPVNGDPRDEDSSLTRTSHVLDEDAHVDDSRPGINFGQCPELQLRVDNGVTSFVDNDLASHADDQVTPGTRTETLWDGVLRATVKSVPAAAAGAPIPIGAHRVVSDDWNEGQRGCAGDTGSGHEARGGAKPLSEGSPVASTAVAEAGTVSWDVSEALDSRDERLAFNGFELRTEGSGGSTSATDTLTLHSSEETEPADHRPRLVTIRTGAEQERCVDADQERSTGPSDGEQRIHVSVTDGRFLAQQPRVSKAGGDLDGCRGTPVAGASIAWEIDDDSPDAYISSLAGDVPPREVGSRGDAGPNRGSALAGPDGRSFIDIRLAEPYAEGRNSGENRIAAIYLNLDRAGGEAGGANPQGTCEPGDTTPISGGLGSCSTGGENQFEDDVTRVWDPVPPPPPGEGAGTPPGGAPSGGGGGAPEGAQSPSRSIALGASRSTATVGEAVRLAGRLASPAAACAGPREFVQILRRPRGERERTDFASVSTAPDGSFELPVLVDQSAEYVAVAPTREECAGASSPPVDVGAQGRVRARVAGPSTIRRGQRAIIKGSVLPALRGSVVLERRAGRRWQAVAHRRLGRRSTFSFPVRARWSRRTFRVRWLPPTSAYLGGVSRALTVRTRPAR